MSLMLFFWRVCTCFPKGLWHFGLLAPENNTRVLHPVGPIKCMGPVSFPIAKAAPRAKGGSENKSVCPVKFKISGQCFSISELIFFSESVPRRTG